MKPAKLNRQHELPDSKLDQILAGEETLLPSSGFLSAVMDRVQEEAAAPAPIPFPWRRVLPGLLPILALLGWAGYNCLGPLLSALRNLSFSALLRASEGSSGPDAGIWIAAAFLVAIFSWLFARRINGSGLL
jgi:hypothetical protein